jgi:hypothetical protein
MKRITLIVTVFFAVSMNSFAQDTTFKFIFVPHVRSEDKVAQSVNPGIAKIDFTKYSLKMLGGDLAQQTSKGRTTLHYDDSLFDLKNPNTLWSIGNHDLEEGDSNLIKEFTGRQLYYSYYRDGITFLVLNTETGAEAFQRTFIKSPQLDTIKAVCNRITSETTKFLIVLHSRYMWMINNTYFTQKMKDSIAASSKSMDTTNFYSDIFPLLKQVKSKGINVLVFGGDKSQINVTYVKDSITFYAARMENTFSDSVNNVIVLTYVKNKTITCKYVTLKNVNAATEVIPDITLFSLSGIAGKPSLKFRQSLEKKELSMMWQANNDKNGMMRIFGINGALYFSKKFKTNETITVHIDKPGIYAAQAMFGNATQVQKFVVR